MVHECVVGQGIKAQFYFVTVGDTTVLTEYLTIAVPGITPNQCEAFISKEKRIIHEYFGPDTGQTGTIFAPGTAMSDMCESIVQKVRERINERRGSMAA